MKNIVKILKNIVFFIKLSFKETPLQYLSAVLEIIWNVSTPFINLVFPKWIIDELTNGRQWSKVLLYIALWGGVNALIVLIKTVQELLITPHQERNELKENMYYGKMDSHMDYGRLENGSVMDEKNRIRDNLYISYFAHIPLAKLITAILKAMGYSYIIITLNPIILGILVLSTAATTVMASKKQKHSYVYQQKISPYKRRFEYIFKALVDISYAKEVRINNAAKWLSNKFESEKDGYIKEYSHNQKKNLIIDTRGDILTFVQTIILQTYCAFLVIDGAISVGSFSMYLSTFLLISGAFSDTISQIVNLKYVSKYIESFKKDKMASTPSHHLKGQLNIPLSNKHELEFKNVSFKYPGGNDYVLKNISLRIDNGSKLSVVGYNGAGKSTLIKLICRLYEPTEGVILYNGIDISTLRYKDYIKLISVVFQDYNIYYFSVRDNVSLVSDNPDEEAIVSALKLSGLERKMRTLPKGLDTQIGKEFDHEGIEFSGGEGQKLACARAYFKDSPIVILDEPTASLDPISERQLYERFDSIVKGKTSIYISHRLARSKYCDNIIVLEDGQIIESGTHKQLVSKKGIYAEMYTKQSEHYMEDTDECEQKNIV